MDRQIIITICREYGSMGHEIAARLAERLDVKLYDKELLYGMAEAEGMDHKIIHKYDEKAINPFMSKTIGNHSNSIEKILAEKILPEKVTEKESLFLYLNNDVNASVGGSAIHVENII